LGAGRCAEGLNLYSGHAPEFDKGLNESVP